MTARPHIPMDVDDSGDLPVEEGSNDNVQAGYGCQRFVQSYPSQVAATLGQAETRFEAIKREQGEQCLEPHGPFVDSEEWELVKWLFQRVGQNGIEEFTKLKMVSY